MASWREAGAKEYKIAESSAIGLSRDVTSEPHMTLISGDGSNNMGPPVTIMRDPGAGGEHYHQRAANYAEPGLQHRSQHSEP